LNSAHDLIMYTDNLMDFKKITEYSLRFKIKVTLGHKLRYEIKVTFGEVSFKLYQTNWNVAKNNVTFVVDEVQNDICQVK
jgi:hypothetical protein